MRLPSQFREHLILLLDEYLETVNDEPDATTLAEYIVENLEPVAEEAEVEDPEELLDRIEEEAELEEPLVDVLAYEFEHASDLDLTGEGLVDFIAKILDLEFGAEDELDELDEEDLSDFPSEADDFFDEDEDEV